jgi:hypothetical protein
VVVPGIDHLTDFVAFAVQGEVSAAAASAGGDLDGDQYTVIWDTDLLPRKKMKAYSYPPPKQVRKNDIRREDMIVYFAGYTNASLGRITTLYNEWVCRLGAACSQCLNLNSLFSLAVDGQYVEVPENLKNPPGEMEPNKFVWQQMHTNSELFLKSKGDIVRNNLRNAILYMSKGEILDLVAAEDTTLSEYELFQLISRWCWKQREYEILPEIGMNIDFSNFTTPQKKWAILAGMPQHIVYSAINQSKILSHEDLRSFKLELPDYARWKLYYSSILDEGFFPSHIVDAIERFTRKMIVLRVDDRLRVGIFLKGIMHVEEENKLVSSSEGIVFSFGNFGKFKRILDSEYIVYFDGFLLQIYRTAIGNTFIWMKRDQVGLKEKALIRVCTSRVLTCKEIWLHAYLGRIVCSV